MNQGPKALQAYALPLSYTSMKGNTGTRTRVFSATTKCNYPYTIFPYKNWQQSLYRNDGPGGFRSHYPLLAKQIRFRLRHEPLKNKIKNGPGGFRSHYLNVANVTRFRLRHKPLNTVIYLYVVGIEPTAPYKVIRYSTTEININCCQITKTHFRLHHKLLKYCYHFLSLESHQQNLWLNRFQNLIYVKLLYDNKKTPRMGLEPTTSG